MRLQPCQSRAGPGRQRRGALRHRGGMASAVGFSGRALGRGGAMSVKQTPDQTAATRLRWAGHQRSNLTGEAGGQTAVRSRPGIKHGRRTWVAGWRGGGEGGGATVEGGGAALGAGREPAHQVRGGPRERRPVSRPTHDDDDDARWGRGLAGGLAGGRGLSSEGAPGRLRLGKGVGAVVQACSEACLAPPPPLPPSPPPLSHTQTHGHSSEASSQKYRGGAKRNG